MVAVVVMDFRFVLFVFNDLRNNQTAVAQLAAEFFLYCATSLRSFCFVCVCVINI